MVGTNLLPSLSLRSCSEYRSTRQGYVAMRGKRSEEESDFGQALLPVGVGIFINLLIPLGFR